MDTEIKIGNEDRAHPLEAVFEKEFDKGWRNYVRDIIKENKRSNSRLFKVLVYRMEPDFIKDTEKLLKTVGGTCRIQIVRCPSGIVMTDRRWKSFPFIWVDQKQTSIYGAPEGTIQVKLDDKRYLSLHYNL